MPFIGWIVLIAIVIIGAVSGRKTLTNSFALGLDILGQNIGANSKLGITISARCGLAARRGKTWGARGVCWLFKNPNHCEQAIGYDIVRQIEALDVLFDGKPPAEFAVLKSRVHLDYTMT